MIRGDCREVLPTLGQVDAVVADPPYGVAMRRGDSKICARIQGDDTPPIVTTLAQWPAIIWGGNNFCDQLPLSTGWLVWFKHQPEKSEHSQAELAWTNVVKTVRHYAQAYHGFMRARDGWFHSTQKPVQLFQWCLSFLPTARIIVDPYMGSGPVGIACLSTGQCYIGIEIAQDHFDTACSRIEAAYAQLNLYQPQTWQVATQLTFGVTS